MVILIVLVILWTPYVVTKLLRAQHARTPSPTQPETVRVEPAAPAETDTGSQDGPVWSALDDRQLTRPPPDSDDVLTAHSPDLPRVDVALRFFRPEIPSAL